MLPVCLHNRQVSVATARLCLRGPPTSIAVPLSYSFGVAALVNSPTCRTLVARSADLQPLFNYVNSTCLAHTTWTPANQGCSRVGFLENLGF